MKKRLLLFILFFVFFIMLTIGKQSYAAELDRIINYNVVVEPRMNDGTLDITYTITWKVLDSTTEGPLEWVQIGTPNENFDGIVPLSTNIKSISKSRGAYVNIHFDKKYYAGQQITFKYRIHQSHMYKISLGKCKYSFTPAWFTDTKIDNMTVKWNNDQVQSNNSKTKEGSYLVWKKTNMNEGEKITVKVKYDKDAFGYLNTYKQYSDENDIESGEILANVLIGILVLFLICISIFYVCAQVIGGGYYGHRGFYRGYGDTYYDHYDRCVESSCACASSCASSCACACAGSGRAGCSKKDFYGTKINKNKLKKILK